MLTYKPATFLGLIYRAAIPTIKYIEQTTSCRLYGLRKYKKDIKKAIIDESN